MGMVYIAVDAFLTVRRASGHGFDRSMKYISLGQ